MGNDKNGRKTSPDGKKPIFERISGPEDAKRYEQKPEEPEKKPQVNPPGQLEPVVEPSPQEIVQEPAKVEPEKKLAMSIPELDDEVEEVKQEMRASAKEVAEQKYKARVDTLQKALADPYVKGYKWGVVGIGQGGGRIAEQFGKFGYSACAINTAKQDLAFIDLPDDRKLFMEYSLGGAGKDMTVGSAAIKDYQNEVTDLLRNSFHDVETLIVAVGGGGGTGSGGAEQLIKIVTAFGIPVVVLYTLPQESEGAITKSNAIRALDRVSRLVQSEDVNALIVVDNSKIQQIYPDITAGQFWKVANFDIVNVLNMFNTLCRCDTDYDSLDQMDFARIFTGGNCMIYGKLEIEIPVENGQITLYESELANAVTKNLQDGLLADGFDLKEAVAGGIIVTGSEEILNQIPAIHINFMYHQLNELVGDANIYRGLYRDDNTSNVLTIYTIFSGLGLPQRRVKKLLQEAKQAQDKIQSKTADKNKMVITDDPMGGEQNKMEEMQQRNTAFGRLAGKRGRRGGPSRG